MFRCGGTMSEIPTKVVDTKEYVSALKELTEQGLEVSVTIAGNSMWPFLADGRDRIFFSKPARRLKKGDIVFYQRGSGQYVCHRIVKVTGGREKQQDMRAAERQTGRDDGEKSAPEAEKAESAVSFYIAGDAQIQIEGPVRQDQIFAVVTSAERKGKRIEKGNFTWDFFEKVWIRIIPLRPFLVKTRNALVRFLSVSRKQKV